MTPVNKAGLSAIQRAAKAQGVAWQPLAAIAARESNLNPLAVGDKGTSFGLDQEHVGGALPTGLNRSQIFNADRQAQQMARAVKGLGIQGMPFAQQTYQISKRYERPADVQGETRAANDWLRSVLPSLAGFAPGPAAAPAPAAAAPAAGGAPRTAGFSAAQLSALQSSADQAQRVGQRAQDALGAISGHSHGVQALDLSPFIDQVLQGTPAPQAASQTSLVPKSTKGPKTTKLDLAPGAGGYALPLGTDKYGRLGVPYQGTHTLYGNWESDNAVDMGTPVGTPVYAVQSGTIGSQIGSLGAGKTSNLEGLRVHLKTAGNEFYYAHLSRLAVKAGQRVQKGQLIGYSGAASGVGHLHIAAKSGDPRNYFNYGK